MANGEIQRPKTELDANHRRQLFSVFKHVDKLLAEILAIAEGSMSGSPFEAYIPDLPVRRRDEIEKSIEYLKRLILRILEEKGIIVDQQCTSAAHAVRIRTHLVEIAFESLKPKRMNGYGQLTPRGCDEMNEVVDELAKTLRLLQETSEKGSDK
jgi:hypothetical protein